MSLLDLLQYRRSVRYYDPDKPLDSEKVRHCLQQATLSPSSSNMQLYEFYHITDKSTLQQLAHACFNQQPATTAQQMVVFVVRQDLYRQRAAEVMAMEQEGDGTRKCETHQPTGETGIPAKSQRTLLRLVNAVYLCPLLWFVGGIS